MLKIKNWNVMGQEDKNKEVYQKFLKWDKLSDIDKKTTIMEIIDMNPKSLKYIHSKVETIFFFGGVFNKEGLFYFFQQSSNQLAGHNEIW